MSSFYYVEPTESQRLRGNRFVDRFVAYGSGGLLDPKMPAEAYAFGRGSTAGIFTLAGWRALGVRGFLVGAGTSMAMASIGTGLVGAIFDPFEYNEGGLDEYISLLRWRSGWKKFEHEASQIPFLA